MINNYNIEALVSNQRRAQCNKFNISKYNFPTPLVKTRQNQKSSLVKAEFLRLRANDHELSENGFA